MSDPPGSETAAKGPRYVRRTWDHILTAFHQACDQGDFEIAELLLAALEMAVSRHRLPPGAIERRAKEGLVAAYERFWLLRHPRDAKPDP